MGMSDGVTWADTEPRMGVTVPPALALHRVAKTFRVRVSTVEREGSSSTRAPVYPCPRL